MLESLGPFFAVETHTAAPGAPWREFHEPDLTARVRAVRRHLARDRPEEAVELRVAASVAHLGLAARLLSPALALNASCGQVPADVWWQDVVGGAVPLSVRPVTGELTVRLLDGLGAAVRPFSVSPQVLWGNVASAVNGAVTMIDAAAPDWAGRARELAAELLARPPLRGTSTVVGGRFRRRSCCLIYRAAPGGTGPVCGDCVLQDAVSMRR
ncbi:(2Fe-2S)-binding protein [Amycolatopsis sp.]|uniref:(2Fe-2S)-binding protein n=1 Tax=Amycolatopsis sp. TaxID=37632 RepID=UPI002CEB20AD|nr:(2Fe-2S)-binding protein [Amycolatopsis sp.]HVV09839.1 (2Fe-2S)-binding protein [Amycolatopsis sp.]